MTPRAIPRRDCFRRWVWAPIDAVIGGTALCGAPWLRFDFDRQPVLARNSAWFAVTAACATILVGALIGLGA